MSNENKRFPLEKVGKVEKVAASLRLGPLDLLFEKVGKRCDWLKKWARLKRLEKAVGKGWKRLEKVEKVENGKVEKIQGSATFEGRKGFQTLWPRNAF